MIALHFALIAPGPYDADTEVSLHIKLAFEKFVRIPKFEEVPYPVVMEPNLVIEYYSR